jgi:phage tail sheath protein FI
MSNFTAPGVYVQEGPLLTFTPRSSSASIAAFFGEAERGPVTPVLIEDWSSYRRVFGDLNTEYDLGYSVYHYFTNGGRAAWVTRVVGDSAAVALNSGIPYLPNGVGAASAVLFSVSATGEGIWGNNLTVEVSQGNVAPSSNDIPTFSIVVRLSGLEVERWLELTADRSRSRFVETVVNRSSSYIKVTNTAQVTPSATWQFAGGPFSLSGGVDSVPVDTDYVASFNRIDNVDASLLLNAVGRTSQTVVQALLSKAASRGDSFAIIDPSASDEDRTDIEATVASYVGIGGASYGAVYAPRLLMVDPTKTGVGAIRETFPGGAVAGLYARTEVERTIAKAPAGFNSEIRGAFGLSFPVNETDTGLLYAGNPPVNVFKAVPGGGIVVNGARTLSKRDPDLYINVRRTLNYLKRNLKQLTQFAVFENNDYILWSSLTSTITGFLNEFWQSGGLKGRSANEAFIVTCDSTNNTPATTEQGIINVEVAVAVLFPAEFIVIQLSQWAGGSAATENR